MRSVVLLIALLMVVAACGDSEGGADPDRFCELLGELDTQNTSGMSADEALPIIQEGRDKYVEGLEVVLRIEELGQPGGTPRAPVIIESVTVSPA